MVISKHVANLITAIAEFLRKLVGNRDIEAFIVDLIAGKLDTPQSVELYLSYMRIT